MFGMALADSRTLRGMVEFKDTVGGKQYNIEFYHTDLIKENYTIEELYLVIDTLSEKYISKIADSLKENRILKKLVLYESYRGMICDNRVKVVDHKDIYWYIKTL